MSSRVSVYIDLEDSSDIASIIDDMIEHAVDERSEALNAKIEELEEEKTYLLETIKNLEEELDDA